MKIKNGTYAWDIDINLLKTPFILFTVCKVLLVSALSVPALLAIIDLAERNFELESLMTYLKTYLLTAGILTVLAVVGYYAVFIPVAGVKYGLCFQMDGSGVDHIVRSSQRDRNYLMFVLGMTAGLSTGNPGVAGASSIAGSRNNMYTRFEKVKKIICLKRSGIIKLVCRDYTRNAVFVKKENLNDVFEFIRARCESAIVKTKRF
jgi:hypothetical protein